MSDRLNYRQRWGLVAALQTALLYRLRRWLGLRIYGIYVMPLELRSGPDPVLPGYSARLFQRGEADALIARAGSVDLDLSERFVRDALDKGDVCLAVLRHDEIVAYTWCAFAPTHDEDGVFAGFADRYRYAYKSLTLPEYRGQHALRTFAPIRDRYCVTARGCTHHIAYVDLDNRSSIRFVRALGQRRVGISGYLKRGPIFWSFASTGARAHGFHFFIPSR